MGSAHRRARFESLNLALKELEPFIRNGRHLESGKQFDKFGGMRSREILANWLLCVAVNYADEKRLTFCSDARARRDQEAPRAPAGNS